MNDEQKLIRLLIVEDQKLFRSLLKRVLLEQGDIQLVGEVSSGAEALKFAEKNKFDVVLMDVAMPDLNGIKATQELLRIYPKLKIIGVSGQRETTTIIEMLRSGAWGYFTKSDSIEDLLSAIRQVRYARRPLLSPTLDQDQKLKIIGTIIQDYKTLPKGLTKKEELILKLIIEGHTNKEAAGLLSISPRTVEVHRRNIMKKLEVTDTSSLVIMAIKRGIINIE